MADYNQLKTRAQQVRDEQTIGGNTALRVGQLLMDMVDAESETVDNVVELFTGTEDNPVIPTLPNPGLLHWLQSPIVALVSMGEDLDGDAGAVVQEGDLYYYNHSGYQIFVKGSGSLPGTGYKAHQKVLYLNKYTGKLYEWTGADMSEIVLAGTGGVGVISSLGSDSDEDALSASMGKKLKVAIITILNSLGNYAFPDGKPVIDWGDDTPVYTVSKTIGTGLSASGGDDDVSEGDPLEVTIVITNNMYIVDDDSVVVTMGGSPVVGAWNASTMKVTIAAVYGDVVINVPSLTYVGYGEQNSPLVFNLDGFNRGGVAGHWTDMVGNVDFALTDCTENDDNVEFNGTSSKGVSSGSLNVRYDEGTIESIFDVSASDFPANIQCILTNNTDQGISIGLGKGAAIDPSKALYCYVNSRGTVPSSGVLGLDNVIKIKQQVCFYKLHGYRNGVALTDASPNDGISFTIDSSTQLALGTRHRSSSDNYMKGKIFMVRVYNRELTDSERAQNYKVDKKRYNLS